MFPCGFIIYDYTFLCLHTQSTHFDNSKMVNWVNLVQNLAKIQRIIKNLKDSIFSMNLSKSLKSFGLQKELVYVREN